MLYCKLFSRAREQSQKGLCCHHPPTTTSSSPPAVHTFARAITLLGRIQTFTMKMDTNEIRCNVLTMGKDGRANSRGWRNLAALESTNESPISHRARTPQTHPLSTNHHYYLIETHSSFPFLALKTKKRLTMAQLQHSIRKAVGLELILPLLYWDPIPHLPQSTPPRLGYHCILGGTTM